MSEPIRVPVGEEGWVLLRPALSVPMGTAAMAAIARVPDDQSAIEAALTEVFMLLGISEWSFDDPITAESIARLLPWGGGGMEVASKTFELYGEDFIAPLAPRRSRRLNGGLTENSTSATPASGSPRRKRSRPSSPVAMDTSTSVAPV